MKIYTSDDREEYEELWAKHHMSVLQSWQWGEVKSSSSEILRVKIDNYVLTIQIKSVPVLGWKFGYIPHGGPKSLFTQKAIEQLGTLCTDNDLSHIVIDPYFTDPIMGVEPTGEPWIQSQDTIVTDLSGAMSELQSQMRKKHRQYIRKSERIGLFFETDDSMEGVRRFSEVMKNQFTSHAYLPYGQDYFERLWKIFEGSNMLHVHLAIDASEDVGAYMVIDGSDTTFQFYGGTTQTGRDKYAAYLLTWESMKAAKERGISNYDQWGTAVFDGHEFDKSDEKYGISIFKEGFTGKNIHYADQFAIVNNNSRYSIYKRLISGHRSIIALKKKFK